MTSEYRSLHKWKMWTRMVWGRGSTSILVRGATYIQPSEDPARRRIIPRLCAPPLWLQATVFHRSSRSTGRSERCALSAIVGARITWGLFVGGLDPPTAG